MSLVMRKPVLPYANNKGVDQPAHPRSLISAFVVRCLDSIIPLLAIAEISSLLLVSVAEQAGLSLTWSQSPKTGFLVTRLIWERKKNHDGMKETSTSGKPRGQLSPSRCQRLTGSGRTITIRIKYNRSTRLGKVSKLLVC